jgi:hypothetical protein
MVGFDVFTSITTINTFLERDNAHFGRSLPTFRRDLLSPCSGLKSMHSARGLPLYGFLLLSCDTFLSKRPYISTRLYGVIFQKRVYFGKKIYHLYTGGPGFNSCPIYRLSEQILSCFVEVRSGKCGQHSIILAHCLRTLQT